MVSLGLMAVMDCEFQGAAKRERENKNGLAKVQRTSRLHWQFPKQLIFREHQGLKISLINPN